MINTSSAEKVAACIIIASHRFIQGLYTNCTGKFLLVLGDGKTSLLESILLLQLIRGEVIDILNKGRSYAFDAYVVGLLGSLHIVWKYYYNF